MALNKRGRVLLHETIVKPEWIDHNGHVNVAFFVVAFDEATDAAYEHWGIGRTLRIRRS